MAYNRHGFGQSGEEPSTFAAVVKVGNITCPLFVGEVSPLTRLSHRDRDFEFFSPRMIKKRCGF